MKKAVANESADKMFFSRTCADEQRQMDLIEHPRPLECDERAVLYALRDITECVNVGFVIAL
jgi:hypothetical protein